MNSQTYGESEAFVHYCARTFRNLLQSSARPGTIHELEYFHLPSQLRSSSGSHTSSTHAEETINPYALGALITLLDKEVTFAFALQERWLAADHPLTRWVMLRTGARVSRPDQAQFALFGSGESGNLVTQLHPGTLLEPEAGATAIYCVEQLHEANKPVTLARAHRAHLLLDLSGPGIETQQQVRVYGMSVQEVERVNVLRKKYPLGIDVFLIDATGACLGLPRTTRINSTWEQGADW